MGLRLVFSTVLAASLAAAEPAWKHEITPSQPGPYAKVPSSELDLQVSWKGMLQSGRLRIDFAPRDAKKPGRLVVRSSAESLGPAAGFFPYNSHFWSEMDPGSFQPTYFHASESNKKETVTTATRYFSDRVECDEIKKAPLKAGKHRSRTFNFAPVYDIFSAMLHIRSQKLDTGDRVNLVVQPFATPYLVRVTVKGRENHLGRKTILLGVGMNKIDRKTLELRPYKKLKGDASLWLGDDADRMPVEFRAAVFIGDIRATMTGFTRH